MFTRSSGKDATGNEYLSVLLAIHNRPWQNSELDRVRADARAIRRGRIWAVVQRQGLGQRSRDPPKGHHYGCLFVWPPGIGGSNLSIVAMDRAGSRTCSAINAAVPLLQRNEKGFCAMILSDAGASRYLSRCEGGRHHRRPTRDELHCHLSQARGLSSASRCPPTC